MIQIECLLRRTRGGKLGEAARSRALPTGDLTENCRAGYLSYGTGRLTERAPCVPIHMSLALWSRGCRSHSWLGFEDGYSFAPATFAHHVTRQIARHDPRIGSATNSSSAGFSLPIAHDEPFRHARYRAPQTQDSYLCSWLLLAPPSPVFGKPHAKV
jgi:hypothetical protein